jgi:two-component system phosphate regulon sensor histidine kinase PhoR
MSRPSLLSRLLLLLGILGGGFLLLAGYLYRTTERLLLEELRTGLQGDLAWAASLTRNDPGLLRFPRADSLAKAIAGHKGYRMTLIDSNGVVVGESNVPRDSVRFLANHGARPEVVAARATGVGEARRFSPTIHEEMFYVAYATGRDGAVLRLSAGPATLQGFRAAARRTAEWALLLFLAAAAMLAFWVSRRISRPLLRLRDGARDVSKPLWWDAPFREAEILNEAFTEYAGAVQRLTGEVRAERDRLSAVVDRLEEGVVLLDRAGRVRASNPSALRLLPLHAPSEPIEGRAFHDVVRHQGLARWASEESLRGAGDTSATREGVYQVDKSEEQGAESAVDLLCHLRVLRPGSAEEERLLTLVDVTSFRNLDRAKTDFVANASHELKTPLSSILGYSEALLDRADGDPETRANFLRKIHANSLRLQALVQDLLNLSQLEDGSAAHGVPLRVRDFVQQAWDHHRTRAEASGLRFENRVPPELSWRMEPRDLDLILGNLIGNAVKYNSPGGKVRVEWDAATRKLGVRDTGPGIPEDALPRIFERFYRGGAARAGNEGTGLGLAIVKHAAQRYGIAVSAESAPGEGSRFSLELPGEMGQ